MVRPEIMGGRSVESPADGIRNKLTVLYATTINGNSPLWLRATGLHISREA